MIDTTLGKVRDLIGQALLENRFSVDFPSLGDGQEGNITYFLSSSNTPVKNISEIPVNFQGLQFKIPGDVTFDQWTATFLCDKQNSSYKYVSLWGQLLVDVQSNSRGALENIKKNLEIHQLDVNGQIISTWECVGMFPTQIGEISLSRDSADTIATFSCTFAMDYFNFKSV